MNRLRSTYPGAVLASRAWPCLILVAAFFMLAAPGQIAAQTGKGSEPDAELVRHIRDAVIRELRESGALDREIDQGIERYITRQRAAAAEREGRAADARAAKVRPVSESRNLTGAVVTRHGAQPLGQFTGAIEELLK